MKTVPYIGVAITLLFSLLLSGCNPLGKVSTADQNFLGGVSYSPVNSRVTVSSNSISAGSQSTITLTTRDSGGNVFYKSGLTVVFSVSGGVSAGTLGAVTDNGDGTYAAIFTGETAGTASNVEVKINGELVTGNTSTITVLPGAVSASHSTVSASASPITANGSDTSTITIILKDAFGNLVSNKTVSLTSSRDTADTITTISATTNTSGVASFSVKSSTSGSAVFSATDSTDSIAITQTASISFATGTVSVANSTITGTTSVVANGVATSTVTITLKDASNNSVSGITPFFSATDTGTTNAYGVCSVSNSSGVSTCTLTSTKAETKTLAITSPVSKSDGTVSFVAGPISYAQSTFDISASSLTAGGTATLTLILKDAYDNQIADSTQAGNLIFAKVLGSGASNGTFGAISPVVGNAGAYQATLTATTAGTEATILASLGANDFTPTAPLVRPKITVAPGAVAGAHSLLAASPSSNVIANGSATSTITITARDAYDNPISGFDATTITIASTGTGNTITQPIGTTNASGQVTATISSTKAETKTITLSAPASLTAISSTSVAFVAGAMSLAQSNVSANRISIAADGSTTSTITAILKDANGNGVPSKTVALTSSRGATDIITTSPATTNSSGEASFTVKSSTVGDAVFTAVGDSQTLSQTPTILFLAATPLMDFQAKFFDWLNPGSNTSSTKSTWKDLASTGTTNDGALNNFGFTSTSGWTGDGTTTRSYTDEVMADAPISYWKMDGNFNDSVGTNNGTAQNGTTFGTAFYGTNAGSFDGVDDYVSVPNNSNFNFGANNFAIEWWEYRTDATNGKASIARDNTLYTPYLLGYANAGAGVLQIYMTSNGGSWDVASGRTLGAITLNTWNHFIVTRNGNTFYAYKNGVQTDTWTSSASLLSSSGNIQLGFVQGLFYFQGLIDEVAIYNSSLSSSHTAAHYAARAVSSSVGASRLAFDGSNDYVDFGNGINGSNSASFETWIKPASSATKGSVILGNGDSSNHGLILKQSKFAAGKLELTLGGNKTYAEEVLSDTPTGYWRLGETSGTTAVDSSGNGVNGTIAASDVTLNVNGALIDSDKAMTFASAGMVTLSPALDITTTWTIETWFQYPFPGNCGSPCTLTRGSNDHQILVMPGLQLGSYDNGTGTAFRDSGFNMGSLSTGWHHLVAVASGGTTTFYIDGTSVGSIPFVSTTDIIAIGNYQGGTQPFGTIDEVAVYNTALSSTRIADHYAARAQAITCQSQSSLTDNIWHFVSGSFDSASTTLKLFINGTEECSITNATAVYAGSANNLRAGADSTGANAWSGAIGDIRMYDNAITAANIKKNMITTWDRFSDFPKTVSNLSLWLKADAGITLNGATVSSWADQSGNGYSASQDTASFQPTYVSNGMNGIPVLRFDGNDDYMPININVTSLPATVFLVAARQAGNCGRLFTSTSNWLIGSYGGCVNGAYTGGWVQGGIAVSVGTAQLSSVTQNGSTTQYYINGVNQTQAQIGAGSPPGALVLNGQPWGQYASGDIAEVIVYNKALSDDERRRVEAYLNAKYGIY